MAHGEPANVPTRPGLLHCRWRVAGEQRRGPLENTEPQTHVTCVRGMHSTAAATSPPLLVSSLRTIRIQRSKPHSSGSCYNAPRNAWCRRRARLNVSLVCWCWAHLGGAHRQRNHDQHIAILGTRLGSCSLGAAVRPLGISEKYRSTKLPLSARTSVSPNNALCCWSLFDH